MNFSLQVEHFEMYSYDWVSSVFSPGSKMILGASDEPTTPAFDGSISCLQIFDFYMDPATMHYMKNRPCPRVDEDGNTVEPDSPCPENYQHYDGECFKILSDQYVFSQAEVICLPDTKSPHRSQLIVSDNLRLLNHVSEKVKAKTSLKSYWIGLSDRDQNGVFRSRYVTWQNLV